MHWVGGIYSIDSSDIKRELLPVKPDYLQVRLLLDPAFYTFLEWEPYDGTTRHNNFIIAETLEAIEDVVLFRIANYFLRFSEEYKRQHGGLSHFKNDWYEFVEYGTCNELRITLQRSGFSREASSYIRQNASEYIIWVNDEPKVKLSILECKNDMVKHEAEEIRYNVPELFVE